MFRTVIDQVPEYTFDYSLAKIQFNLFSVAEYKLVYFPLKGNAANARDTTVLSTLKRILCLLFLILIFVDGSCQSRQYKLIDLLSEFIVL